MTASIAIGGREIGSLEPVFIIAEAGVNHNGSLETALQLVDQACNAGADAIKFQLYRVEEQVSHVAPSADYQRDRGGSDNMLEMARAYDLPWEDHYAIVERCQRLGIAYMSSCFDSEAVDLLLDLGADCIKVASGEITNYPLLSHIAATGKPIVLSTGMSTLQDVAGSVDLIQGAGESPIVLLQCVSEYPARPETINLRSMVTMGAAFGVPVGYSDHTLGSTVAVAAVALGACVIEKHFTLDKTLPGPDHAMSLEPQGLREFVCAIRTAEAAFGDGIKRPHPSEQTNRVISRRGLVSVGSIGAGERIDDSNTTLKRPALGIDPRLLHAVRGRKAAVDIPADVPITWEMLS